MHDRKASTLNRRGQRRTLLILGCSAASSSSLNAIGELAWIAVIVSPGLTMLGPFDVIGKRVMAVREQSRS